jgi:hypothetical protein
MLPTCLFAAKTYVAGIALVLEMVMPLRIAVLIASLLCDKVSDAITTLEHCVGDLIEILMDMTAATEPRAGVERLRVGKSEGCGTRGCKDAMRGRTVCNHEPL